MSKIPWCDETINPVIGCSKASEGCANCYAEPMAKRLAAMGTEGYGAVVTEDRWNGRTAFVESALSKPSQWARPRSIFVCSMGDLFHESVRMEWIEQVVGMVAGNPQHTFIFLTKRPERMRDCLGKLDHGFFSALYQLQAGTAVDAANWPLPNLVLGVSVENQKAADERIPCLLGIPAAKRFVSLEPMVGPVDLSYSIDLLGGVILGGESGANARCLYYHWVTTIQRQCAKAGVPFMFKQASGRKGNHWLVHRNGFPELDGEIHTELAWTVRKGVSCP